MESRDVAPLKYKASQQTYIHLGRFSSDQYIKIRTSVKRLSFSNFLKLSSIPSNPILVQVRVAFYLPLIPILKQKVGTILVELLKVFQHNGLLKISLIVEIRDLFDLD